LIDKSLLRQTETKEGEPRFTMFETIREFALERLQMSEDWPATRRRHADFYLALAEQAEPELTGAKQGLWLDILEREHDNLRAVISWREENAQADYGLRLGAAIWRFWLVRGHKEEGRERLTTLLAMPGADQPTPLRARALNAVGTLMHGTADYDTAHKYLEESLEISRQLGDKHGMANVINNLSWIAAQLGNLDKAKEFSSESLALHTELGDKRGQAVAFNNLARAAHSQSELVLASSLQEKNLRLRREIGDERGVAFAMAWLAWIDLTRGHYHKAAALLDSALKKLRELDDSTTMAFSMWILAQLAIDQGDFSRAGKLLEEDPALLKEKRGPHILYLLALVRQHEGKEQQAQALLEESLTKFRAWADKWGSAITLYYMGRLAFERHDNERAAVRFQESIILNRDLKNTHGIAKVLIEFGILALAQAHSVRSTRLFAAAEALHQAIGAVLPPLERTRFDHEVQRMRSLLDEETFSTAWNAGKNMTAEQAVSYALEATPA
jgi:tetratricopeptide (TPR) repeat protein